MKIKFKIFLVLSMVAIVFTACEEDAIDTYTGDNDISFLWTSYGTDNFGRTKIDSTSFTFAFESLDVTEYLYTIPVTTQGFLADYDRTFSVKLASDNQAKQGVHFNLPGTYTVPANETVGEVPITLYRTADLKEGSVSLKLELVANANFTTDLLVNQESSNADRLLRTDHTLELTLSDILTEPVFWSRGPVYYLGDFSAKKLYLFAEVNNIPVPNYETSADFERAIFISRGKILEAYLNEQAAAGTPVLEEDGTPMVLGRYL